jgi:hypothetical protein
MKKLTDNAMSQINNPCNDEVFRFIEDDIKELSAITRHRSDIYFSAGMMSLLSGEAMTKERSRGQKYQGDYFLIRVASKYIFVCFAVEPQR